MPRITSQAMAQALKACTAKNKRLRLTPTAAAEAFGVPRNSIYKHSVYQAFIIKQRSQA